MYVKAGTFLRHSVYIVVTTLQHQEPVDAAIYHLHLQKFKCSFSGLCPQTDPHPGDFCPQTPWNIRIGKNHSGWSQLNGAMPQGSRLGPLSFLVLIDDLEVGCLVHKFIDDTTLTELLDDRTKQSNMQSCFDSLLTWSDKNDMAVNFNKTKEMVMGPPSLTSNLPLIHTTTGHIERVNSLNYWVSTWTLILPGTHT